MSKTKRISLITLLATLILSMLALIVMGVGQKQAYASEPTLFAFEDGASVKIIEDGGMRFRLQMDETTASDINGAETNELSFYVVPEKYYEENMTDSDLENLLFENCGSNKAQKVVADKNKIYKGVDANGNDGWFANCLLDINLDEFDGAYNTVNFIVFASWNGNLVESEIRNLSDVASSAALDEYYDEVTSIYTWLGSEQYALSVDTAEEMDALIQNASKFSNMEIEVWNDFDMDGISGLPANVKLYHKVSFYNDDQLLSEQWVEDGQDAEVIDTPKSESTELLYASSSNYVLGRRYFWTVNNEEVDINSICKTISKTIKVDAKSKDANITSDLIGYAYKEEPKTALMFDREVGFTQIKLTTNNVVTYKSKEFINDPDNTLVKAAKSPLTKVTFNVTDANVYMTIDANNPDLTYGDNDYVSFSVYVEAPENVTTAWIRLGSTPGVQVVANSWGLVTFNAKALLDNSQNDKNFMINFNGYQANDEVSLYFGKATIIPSEEVKNLTENAATDTYQVGDTTLVGTAYKVTWGTDYRTDIFKQSTELNPTYINGQLLYYGANGNFVSRYIGLEFQTAMTGKVYFVARGLSTVIADGKMPFLNLYSSRASTTRINWVGPTIVGKYADGYIVYEFDFGTTPVGYITICSRTELAGQQILIKNITQTEPTDMIPV